MRIGSLCSGYGGLDAAVREVLGGELAFVADNDPDKSAILAYRFPAVPNLGDLEAVDWSAVEPVDVLTAGFPCKDISCAGQQAGLRKGNRSGVWYHVARAIAELRPPLVVIENVKELLSVGADSDVEPCPWCLGDAGPESAMRALGAVLADLAEIGFDAEWVSVPAASAGACHLRWRVFVLAWPAADTAGHQPRRHEPVARDGAGDARNGSGAGYRITPADPESVGEREPADEADAIPGGRGARLVPGGRGAGVAAGGGQSPADPASHGRDKGRTEPAGVIGGPDAAERGHAPTSDTDHGGRRGGAPEPQRGPEWGTAAAWHRPGAFGRYETAIRRHERAFGRLVPAPVETNSRGNPRLSPRFSEWMMGLPGGWVTDVPGLSRNAQLAAIGDGVVPQQAAMALRLLLDRAGIPSLIADRGAA